MQSTLTYTLGERNSVDLDFRCKAHDPRLFGSREYAVLFFANYMVIDGRWSVVGSCNLDPRSLRMNLEFLAVIHSPQMAAALKRVCYEEICASERVRLAHIRKHSCWQRMLNRLAWAMRDWL